MIFRFDIKPPCSNRGVTDHPHIPYFLSAHEDKPCMSQSTSTGFRLPYLRIQTWKAYSPFSTGISWAGGITVTSTAFRMQSRVQRIKCTVPLMTWELMSCLTVRRLACCVHPLAGPMTDCADLPVQGTVIHLVLTLRLTSMKAN